VLNTYSTVINCKAV